MTGALDVAAARRHLAALAAAPRPAGSAAEGRAREYCTRHLAEHGFSVAEEPFEYSAAPGRLATPLAGVASILALAAAAYLGSRGRAALALGSLLGAGSLILGAAAWAARWGVLALPLMRARGVNLVATRGAPRVWLVAHLDTKSQPVPIGVRALGIMGSGLCWAVALVVAAAQLAGRDAAWAWPLVGAAGLLLGIPVAASVVGTRSPGALDNASGVAAVLLAAGALPRDRALGVVLTSAEELGLAGARAWAVGRAPAVAVNFDGLDDAGMLRVTWTRRRPDTLLAPILRAARSRHVVARPARLIPGILVDGVALADAGWDVVTLSKGTARTVGRIHTPRDAVHALDGRGVADAAAVATDALREIA